MSRYNGRIMNEPFLVSELLAMNAAEPNGSAVLVLEPAAFAVLGRISVMVDWSALVVDDVSDQSNPLDRVGDVLREEMRTQMGLNYNLGESLERVADAAEAGNVIAENSRIELQRIADALVDSQGDGIADIIALLPVLLGSSNATAEAFLAEVQSGRLDTGELVGTSGSCCTPPDYKAAESAVEQGWAILPYDNCVNAPFAWSPQVGYSETTDLDQLATSWKFVPQQAGAQDLRFKYFVPAGGEYEVSYNISMEDSGTTLSVYLYDEDFNLLQQNFQAVSFVEETVTANVSAGKALTLVINYDSAPGGFLTGQICQNPNTTAEPSLIMSLNQGIGRHVSGTLLKNAEGWVHNAFSPADEIVLEAEIGGLSTKNWFVIDWTRVYDGTIQIDVMSGSTVIATESWDASTRTRADTLNISGAYDRVILRLKQAAAQALADILIWAYKE